MNFSTVQLCFIHLAKTLDSVIFISHFETRLLANYTANRIFEDSIVIVKKKCHKKVSSKKCADARGANRKRILARKRPFLENEERYRDGTNAIRSISTSSTSPSDRFTALTTWKTLTTTFPVYAYCSFTRQRRQLRRREQRPRTRGNLPIIKPWSPWQIQPTVDREKHFKCTQQVCVSSRQRQQWPVSYELILFIDSESLISLHVRTLRLPHVLFIRRRKGGGDSFSFNPNASPSGRERCNADRDRRDA